MCDKCNDNKSVTYLNYVKNIVTSQLEDYNNGLTIDKKSLINLFIKAGNVLKGKEDK